MTTKRAAIRRRLAVRRAANRPPWGGRKVGHGVIVAPLASRVAATVAATAVVGLGVALARSEQSRRSARVRRARDRQFALWPQEQLADGLKRMALEQLDYAIELLDNDGGVPHATAVHETRKSLKRLRTLLRMLEQELGETAFAREDAALREAGRRLAGARDAEVMVKTLDGLLKRGPGKLARRRGVVRLRMRLAAERDWEAGRALGDAAAREQALGDLRAVRGRVADWSLPNREGIGTVASGLKRCYRQGRRRYRLAGRRKGDAAPAMHQWRKRVKELRYAMEMLNRRDPEGAGRGNRKRRGRRRGKGADRRGPGGRRRSGRRRGRRQSVGERQANRIRRVIREADELAEVLGEEHDLAMLDARLRERGEGGGQGQKKLLKLIARRRKGLRRKALRKGAHLYRRSPKRFVRRVGKAYVGVSRA
jgi:CHAD domain-containing protein